MMVMNECYGKKFVLNGKLEPSDLFDNSIVYEGDSVYEVIRMVKGNPVFFHDHMERLESSIRLQHKTPLADRSAIRRDIIKLTKTDRKREINLKIVFNYNMDTANYLIYFIEPIYPSEEQYREGVKGILFYAERKDPESKVINHKLRSFIYQKLILERAYEALLVNEKNEITEGSRSNIFFLRGNKLTTAPDYMILNGITRKHILDICNEEKIDVTLKCIRADSISEYDAVFMTGTSPMVLPFNLINDIAFRVQFPVIDRLRELYIKKAEESIQRFMKND